ncbi:MAG: hypothetical protein IJ759_04645 [Bacteroidales bacterium]|nr:hypothetical protein [Bacteroidales bacterium]
MDIDKLTALIIFVITYLGIIFNKLPLLNLNRKTSAYAGSAAMILFGMISFEDAVKSIDFNTIVLLLGMMIIISALQLEGFFTLISRKTMSSAKNTSRLLTLVVFITGIASAFLVNDAVVLLFTPVIINICKKSSVNSIPFLLGEIFSSNAGSLMTITGNPQNMIIGIASGISYVKFIVYMLPIAIVSMLIIIYIIKKTNRDIFSKKQIIKTANEDGETYNLKNMRATLIIFVLVVLGFFFGKIFNLSIPLIALVGSALTIMFSKQDSKEIFKGVDFSLLLFFASLFIIVAAVKQSGVLDAVFEITLHQNAVSLLIIFALSLVLSQLVSNVPYTILVLPIFTLANSQILWLSLAASSTLAGNLTIIGAMANLIVIEQAEKEGVKITARKFYRPAILITILTYLFAIVMFMIY